MYSGRRTILVILNVIGWLLSGAGAIVFLNGLLSNDALAGALTVQLGLTGVFLGLILIASTLVGDAVLDGSEAVQVIAKRVEGGLSARPISDTDHGSADTLPTSRLAESETSWLVDGVMVYKVADGFAVAGKHFQGRIEADSYAREIAASKRGWQHQNP